MTYKIERAAVLGAGVMGSTIAAHLANVGIKTYLLDIVPKELNEEEKKKGLNLDSQEVRNRYALKGKEIISKSKPAALYVSDDIDLITAGNIEDHLIWLKDVDWIIEVVVENLEIKKNLMQKVAKYRKPGTIVSTNTSGISIDKIVEEQAEELRQHFLGTHFFNPPRYMKLLEIIPSKDTLPELVKFMQEFGERVLGKGVVPAKDTPNFIANRIGVFGLMSTIRAMTEYGFRIEEVDALTGQSMGRPKSASFRTLDMVGIDTFVHVCRNVYENVPDEEKKYFVIPEFLQNMVKNGWLGDKTKQGFYKKVKIEGSNEILVFDYKTMEYRVKEKVNIPLVELAKNAKGLKDQLNLMVYGKDSASKFIWQITKELLLYSAAKIPEIADSILEIDKAMKWGFNWKMGPFETWDAIGVEKSVERMKAEGENIPEIVEKLLAAGYKSFYRTEKGLTQYFDFATTTYKEVRENKKIIFLKSLKEQTKVIKANSGASLIDIGDDVACLEFHSPNNVIGTDIIEMINYSVEEVERNYKGLVIGNHGRNFCVGANLMQILLESEDENWDELDLMVRNFQNACMKLKYSNKPVVAAPFAMTLGGGCEIVMHSSAVQAAAETYMGLVELGVGLIPGGGGTKEVLLRNIEAVSNIDKIDLQPFVNRAFETIAMAKVSTSGKEAKKLGYIRMSDGITVNDDYLIGDAKEKVLYLYNQGYKAPKPPSIRIVGKSGYAVMQLGAYTLRKGGYISEYDEYLANKVAFILAGGNLPANTLVSEQYLLDLEREAFLSLCGEPKSQARMLHMLKKGKPLRN